MNTESSDRTADKLLLLSVVEGLRLVMAFKKIVNAADRRILIELAERLAK